jgi:glutathione peroxidase
MIVMKLIALIFAFGLISKTPPNNFYNLAIHNLNDSTINMSSFQGRNVLIAEFDASNPDHDFLTTLDSLRSSDTRLVVIVVPATDFNGNLNSGQLQSLKSAVKGNYLVSETGKVSKSSGNAQLPLFKWLTDVSENTHFDTDVTVEKQIFLVSSKGELFAMLGKDTPFELISTLLENAPN